MSVLDSPPGRSMIKALERDTVPNKQKRLGDFCHLEEQKSKERQEIQEAQEI